MFWRRKKIGICCECKMAFGIERPEQKRCPEHQAAHELAEQSERDFLYWAKLHRNRLEKQRTTEDFVSRVRNKHEPCWTRFLQTHIDKYQNQLANQQSGFSPELFAAAVGKSPFI